MGFRIEEQFVVNAPAPAVWAYLVDPTRVVTCLPGAELREVVDPRTFRGAVKVKVGAITVAYQGTVRLVEVDEAARSVRMTGEGRESTGSGAAKMTMSSTVTDRPEGGVQVRVQADVDVVGRLVQLGRGMIEQVSHQLFQQFAACVRATLEAEAAARGTAAAAVAVPAVEGGLEAPPGGPQASGVGPPAEQPPAAAASRPPSAPLARAEPVRIVPLVLRALWALVVGFFRRLLPRHRAARSAQGPGPTARGPTAPPRAG
jgi:carbon monoxide dehydrogenase subunit G